jgi:1-aminocyclopropane-1-carboxylate deaminase/D-cysteine desulfhydrase-like pyridoxal-dependent ACC family enzyme
MDTDPLEKLQGFPRLQLAFLPTPVVEADVLRRHLGPDTPAILFKMDDWTGFALGGNKVRKLEFYLGEAPPETDVLITSGGPQSNHCRVTAAVAAQLGMECVLVVNGEPPEPPTGNALLMQMFGARVRSVASREDRAGAMEEVAEELRARGRSPLVIPLGASTPLGALGYVKAAVELDGQMQGRGGWPRGTTWIFVSSSSCGTLAGLMLGFALLERTNVRLVGVSPDITAQEMIADTRAIARGARELLGWREPLPPELVIPDDRFVGGGYGIPTDASREAQAVFGRYAGVVLDPVYTAKAGAGFLAWLRDGRIPASDTALFWHTGGAPGLFV